MKQNNCIYAHYFQPIFLSTAIIPAATHVKSRISGPSVYFRSVKYVKLLYSMLSRPSALYFFKCFLKILQYNYIKYINMHH